MFQLYIFCFSFFALNLLFILFSVHYLVYPITTFIFFTIFIVKYYSNIQKQEAQITHEMNQNFLQNLPKQRLLNEIKMAKRVQQGLLLVESPNIDGINIVKRCIPAENIGGDFFSFICKDHEQMAPHQSTPGIVKYVHSENQHLGIVIGDVAGHGVSSALIMALSAGLFSEIGKQHLSPKKVLG